MNEDEPLAVCRRWHAEARDALGRGADVVALATATAAGIPSLRCVHFKALRPEGFVFCTHYGRRKSRKLAASPHAAMLFYWPVPRRQVRVEGRCRRLPHADSARYFARRVRCVRR